MEPDGKRSLHDSSATGKANSSVHVADTRRLQVYRQLLLQLLADGAESPEVSAHLKHYKICTASRCAECKYIEFAPSWRHELPLVTDCKVDAKLFAADLPCSWLTWRSSGAGCICCNDANLSGRIAQCAVDTFDGLQLVNLRKHHNSAQHRRAATQYLQNAGVPVSDSGDIVVGAPSLEAFERMLVDISKGVAASAGIVGVGQQKKIQKMLSVLV